MREALGRGGGGKIALDPVALRASARKLRDVRAELDLDASRLAQKPVPEMPGGLGAAVAAELAAIAANVRAESVGVGVTADDLDRRVVIAEVNDALSSGRVLSRAELALLVRELTSGGLLAHVSRREALRLGIALGRSMSSLHDTGAEDKQLLALSALAERHRHDPNFGPFAAGVVRGFGAGRFPALTDLAAELGEPASGRVIGDLALLVASASTSGQLRRSDERALASTADRKGLALLLTSPHAYDHRLLVSVGNLAVLPMLRDGTDMTPIGWKESMAQMMFVAIASNTRASADFLAPKGAAPGDEEPLATLWKTSWTDGGKALAEAYTRTTNFLQKEAHYPDGPNRPPLSTLSADERESLLRANSVTYAAIDQTIHHPPGAPMVDALAKDLAHHHIDDLVTSAGALGPDPGLGDPPSYGDPRLVNLNLLAERDLHVIIAQRPEADLVLGGTANAYEANVIQDHTRVLSPKLSWSDSISKYDALVADAHNHVIEGNFASAQATHEAWFKIISGGTSLVLDTTPLGHVPGAAFTADQGVAAAERATAPSAAQLADKLGSANGVAAISQQASIMAGYFQHGHVHAPSAIIDRASGKLMSYPQLVEERAAALDAGDKTHAATVETRLTAYKNWVNLGQVEGGGAAPDPVAKQLSHDVGIEVNNMGTAVEQVLNP